jgi:hypothetical protein
MNPDRQQPGKPVSARIINLLATGAETLANRTGANGVVSTKTPAGRQFAIDYDSPIPVLLSGSSSPYDWQEIFRGAGDTYTVLTGGQSGTANAYEINGTAGLGGTTADIRFTPSDDYRFQLNRYVPGCRLCVSLFCSFGPITAQAGTGVTIFIKQLGVTIASYTLRTTEVSHCFTLPSGTYDVSTDSPCFDELTGVVLDCPEIRSVTLYSTGTFTVCFLDCTGSGPALDPSPITIFIDGPGYPHYPVTLPGAAPGYERCIPICIYKPGTYSASFDGDQCFEAVSASITIGDGCSGTVTLTPTPTTRDLTFVVNGCLNLPLENIEITLENLSLMTSQTLTTNADGTVTFSGVVSTCLYRATPFDPSGRFRWQPYDFQAGCTNDTIDVFQGYGCGPYGGPPYSITQSGLSCSVCCNWPIPDSLTVTCALGAATMTRVSVCADGALEQFPNDKTWFGCTTFTGVTLPCCPTGSTTGSLGVQFALVCNGSGATPATWHMIVGFRGYLTTPVKKQFSTVDADCNFHQQIPIPCDQSCFGASQPFTDTFLLSTPAPNDCETLDLVFLNGGLDPIFGDITVTP